MAWKNLGNFNSHVGYTILRSHSPEEFFIALAIGLLLKWNTGIKLCVFVLFKVLLNTEIDLIIAQQ